MAEPAGLILGGIPILIWVTEQYREPIRTFLKYEQVLTTFLNDLILQREQLYATLRSIGITVFPPSSQEVEARLRHYSPAQQAAFNTVIQQMSEVIERLMVKMKINHDGKPTWTTDPPERAKWEWRRVKRSLSSRDRREAIEDLQRRNIALRNCFEHQELSTITAPTQTIETLQRSFDPGICNTIRSHVNAIHRALRRGWNCNCALPHQAALDLQWHSNRGASQGNQRYDLTLSYPLKSPCGGNWYKTNMWVVEEQEIDLSIDKNDEKNDENTAKREVTEPKIGRVPKKGLRFNLPLRKPPGVVSRCADKLPVTGSSTPSIPISSLCKAVLDNHQAAVLGFLSDIDPSGKASQVFLSPAGSPWAAPMELTSLRSLLTSTPSMRQLRLSRKQRLGLAAAMAWAVLYLGESPWLADTWQKDNVQFILENSNQLLEPFSGTPCISYQFHSQTVAETSANETRNSPSSDDRALHSKLIRNQTLFALGIFLIEVGFNKSFEELRKQAFLGKEATSILEDYQLAIDLADELHLDAGPEYGDAIKRCLRCEFPGRDVTKNFGYAQFRQEFFNGVVAPVQATFDCYTC
ncbi:hypothetical protein BJX64DRAFT_285383 [Aspergillus heterothallicus]